MRRTAFSTHRDALRRPNAGRTGNNNNNSSTNNNGTSSSSTAGASAASTAVSAWIHPRLLDTTAQLLALQPDDPIQVLSTHFALEALQLTSYPDTSAPTEERELDEEVALSRRASPSSPGLSTKVAGGAAARGKASPSSGRGDPRTGVPANTSAAAAAAAGADFLIEHHWVRRRLQPYGLHALARFICPPLQPQAAFASPNAVAAPDSSSRPQQQQWMECFALLHRQSRLSGAERAAVSRRAVQVHGAALPPVDYRAAEETTVSLVFLYVMCATEAHVRRGDAGTESGGDRPHAAFVSRRLQLAVKVLALQLLAASLQHQELERSDQCSSRSSSRNCCEGHAPLSPVEETNDAASPAGSTSPGSASALKLLYALSPAELEQLRCWFQQREREAAIYPAALLHQLAPAPRTSTQVSPVESASSPSTSPLGETPAILTQLQSHILHTLRTIFFSAEYDTHPTSPALISVDAFVLLMQRLSSVFVTLQGPAVSMAVTLNARFPQGLRPLRSQSAEPLTWVGVLLQKCTLQLVEGVLSPPINAPSFPPALPPLHLPPAWRLYTAQVAEALNASWFNLGLEMDARGTSKSAEAASAALLQIAGQAVAGEVVNDSSLTRAFENLPASSLLSSLVSGWLLRVFEAYTLSMRAA